MQVFLKFSGYRTFVIDVEPTTTVKEINEIILNKHGLPKKTYYLVSGGKILASESRVLSEYNISKDSTIEICARLHSQ